MEGGISAHLLLDDLAGEVDKQGKAVWKIGNGQNGTSPMTRRMQDSMVLKVVLCPGAGLINKKVSHATILACRNFCSYIS